ncbi:MFS transporter [Sphingomonas sp. MAH-20]|uniref:MFS transporter n=2 Tax=Sphingomonadaceae TaxID=41297 RepID=A0A6I4J196_9SPHN|nr:MULTISPECIES: MFS transporter [Sphingomonas]MBA2920584.1 MFS transporter [Sphingomonas sp. CGMCC 1.13658]MVO78175.1 MFS transporter [Sphingomonas horti]
MRPFLTLGLLLLVYIFNFADRVLLGVMAMPIKADLGLSDTELGLLGGTAFALFYATLGVPVAWAADRHSRTWIITVSLTLWSGFTAICGMAGSFIHLFLARLGVGVGEAGGVAPSYSMIADLFPPDQRARALGVYSFGIPIGSAIGLAFGGMIATAFDWRVAFLTMGIAGLVIAPVFRLLVRDPMRGGFDAHAQTPRPSVREAARLLLAKRSFWLLSFGSALASTASYGISFWVPSFYVRSFGLSVAQISLIYAGLILVGGLAGSWAGAWLGDRFGPRRRSVYFLIPLTAMLVSLPFFIGAVMTGDVTLSLVLLLVPTALGSMGFGTILTVVQQVVPASLRTTSSSVFLLINNLIGLGLGSAILGLISDSLHQRFGDESLRYALLAGSLFYLAAALLYALASRRVGRDWVS